MCIQAVDDYGRSDMEVGLGTGSTTFCVVAPLFSVSFWNFSATERDEFIRSCVYTQAVDDYVRSDMVVGLGTGSTAYFAVERVGQKLKSGELKNILAIPTSIRTKEQVCIYICGTRLICVHIDIHP